jgi:malate synthase
MGELEMDKLIEKFLAHVEQQEEESVKSVRVGRVSATLLEKINGINDQRNKARDVMNKEIEAYVEEMKEIIEGKVNGMRSEFYASEFNKAADLAWEEVYDELGLADEIREDSFSVNRNTGVVTREISLEDAKKEAANPKVKVINISTSKK